MGISFRKKGNKTECESWGGSDKRNAEWLDRSAVTQNELERLGDYTNNGHDASVFDMEMHLRTYGEEELKRRRITGEYPFG